MSHIDSFPHEIVGLFGNIPVYHPLENIDGDFTATPQQLILGGGSGEHPALVFTDLHACVAAFLNEQFHSLEGTRYGERGFELRKQLENWAAVYTPFIKTPAEVLAYYQWDEETHEQFHSFCHSDALLNPCYQENLEQWLLLSMGEFIFFALPVLAPQILAKLQEPYQHFKHSYYNNILVIPPNFPIYANGGNAFFNT